MQFVINYEEGGENNILHGDAASEAFLSEIVGARGLGGVKGMLLGSVSQALLAQASRPAASVIFSFTSPTAFLLNHEMTAAGVRLQLSHCHGYASSRVIVRCLRNFHRLPLLEDIKRTPTETASRWWRMR